MAGLQRAGADPGIVWFDAHGDVQTPETTASGYLGGMPLRLLTGYRPELIAARLGLRPVPEHRIVLAGARDLDPPEVTYLARAAIRRREVAGLTTGGLTTGGLTTGGLTTGGLTAADLPAGSLYVHADLDVIDAAALPGLRYPVRADRTPPGSRTRCACCWPPARWPRSASPAPGTRATQPPGTSPPS